MKSRLSAHRPRKASFAPSGEMGVDATGLCYTVGVFSMNGTPTSSRTKVRKELMLPWNKYCYFAKIQVATLRPQRDLQAVTDAELDQLTRNVRETGCKGLRRQAGIILPAALGGVGIAGGGGGVRNPCGGDDTG